MMLEVLCFTWSCLALIGMITMCVLTERADHKRKEDHNARIEMMRNVKYIINVMEDMKNGRE